jgi:hypothetical protein
LGTRRQWEAHNIVSILLSRGTFELPSDSRQQLLQKLSGAESSAVRDAFAAVGTSQPVQLTREQKGELLQVVEHWAIAGGFAELPAGIYELRNALIDDLHHAAGSGSVV